MARSVVSPVPLYTREAFPIEIDVPAPRALGVPPFLMELTSTLPPLIVTGPANELVVLIVSGPVPDLVSPPLPPMEPVPAKAYGLEELAVIEPGLTLPTTFTGEFVAPASSKVTLSRLKNSSEAPPFFQLGVELRSQALLLDPPAQTRLAALVPPIVRKTLPDVEVSNEKVCRLAPPAPAT